MEKRKYLDDSTDQKVEKHQQKKKTSLGEKHYSNTFAADMVYQMAPLLADCMTHTQYLETKPPAKLAESVQVIRESLEKLMRIKESLKGYATQLAMSKHEYIINYITT